MTIYKVLPEELINFSTHFIAYYLFDLEFKV